MYTQHNVLIRINDSKKREWVCWLASSISGVRAELCSVMDELIAAVNFSLQHRLDLLLYVKKDWDSGFGIS